jgi:hypothetical protein
MDASYKHPLDTRTPQQLEKMIEIIGQVLSYAPQVKIAGHNQFDNKACPSFFVPYWLRKLKIPDFNIEWRDPYGYGKYLGNPYKQT